MADREPLPQWARTLYSNLPSASEQAAHKKAVEAVETRELGIVGVLNGESSQAFDIPEGKIVQTAKELQAAYVMRLAVPLTSPVATKEQWQQRKSYQSTRRIR